MAINSWLGEVFRAMPCTDHDARGSGELDCWLDQLTSKIGGVIAFKRGVLIHERGSEVMACSFFNNGHGGGCEPGDAGLSLTHSSSEPAVSIDQYLPCFSQSDWLDHGFRWRDSGLLPIGSGVGRLVSRMRGGQGVAASIRSVSPEAEKVATLLQLECHETQISARQILLVSLIGFCLHSSLQLNTVNPLTQAHAIGINLTAKEREILKWVIEGKTSWEIGKIMSTSERTIKFHLKNVYMKLNVSNRAQAVAKISRLGLV